VVQKVQAGTWYKTLGTKNVPLPKRLNLGLYSVFFARGTNGTSFLGFSFLYL